jgi:hypothetical protein
MANIREAPTSTSKTASPLATRSLRRRSRVRRAQDRNTLVKLPADVSGQELVKVLQRIGFVVSRQKEAK